MKKLTVWIVLISLCAPAGVLAGNPFATFDQEPQMFVYMKVPFGPRPHGKELTLAGPRFGLSLNREFSWQSDGWLHENSLWTHRSLPIVDLEFGTQKDSLRLNGANMASSGEDSVWSNPWLWVGIAAGALLVSCVTENFPCENDDSMGGGGGGY